MSADRDSHSGPSPRTATVPLPAPGPAPEDPTGALARWVELRLHETTPWELDEARLYGVAVVDDDGVATGAPGAVRLSLLDRGYPYDVVEGAGSLLAACFDAVALVTLGWQSPIEEQDGAVVRPSRHPRRERVRIVAVARIEPTPFAASLATAVRVRHADEVCVHVDGGGRMADALRNLAAEALAGRPWG